MLLMVPKEDTLGYKITENILKHQQRVDKEIRRIHESTNSK